MYSSIFYFIVPNVVKLKMRSENKIQTKFYAIILNSEFSESMDTNYPLLYHYANHSGQL